MAIGAYRSHDFEADDETNAKLEEEWNGFANQNGVGTSETYIRGSLIAAVLGY